MSQLVSLANSSQTNVFATGSALNFARQTNNSNKELPKWLLEFDSFERKNNSDGKSSVNQRPLTESDLHNQPKWFNEFNQRRRMSDFPSIDLDVVSTNSTSNANSSPPMASDFELKSDSRVRTDTASRRISPNTSELLFLVPSEQSSAKTSRNGTSDGESSTNSCESLRSIMADAELIEKKIFNLSTGRSSIEKASSDDSQLFMKECVIPEMPQGSVLTLCIHDNWGDENFIGLNGIEIFDLHGKKPAVKNIYLSGNNDNEISKITDLRKLIDNVYRTHDDTHIWQCRASKEQLPLHIVLQFYEPVTIALLRIWNHNKSRIHSYRGVKYLQIKLDGQLIFSGEIAKASGDLTGSFENFGDTILFTTDETILEHISKFDNSFQELLLEQIQPMIKF